MESPLGSAEQSQRPHGGLQVLIIEDDQPVRDALKRFVAAQGYVVDTATDGASALGVLAVKRPEVIILDLKMPIMDGYEFMERLAGLMGRWRPRIIVLSAAERLGLAQARFEADAYLPKPFAPDRLRAVLKLLVRPTEELTK